MRKTRSMKMKKHGYVWLTGLSIMVAMSLVVSCDNLFGGPDLRTQVENEVKLAETPEAGLTIVSVSAGITSPSGVLKLKDGIAIEVDVSAQTNYAFIGWRTVSGNVTYQKISDTRASIMVKGSGATIEPVYEERPRVLYTTPVGNNIDLNSNVRAIFSRTIDEASLDAGSVKVALSGVTQISGDLVLENNGTTVKLNPTVDFSPINTYVVETTTAIKAWLDPADLKYSGLYWMNQDVRPVQAQFAFFKTGTSPDSDYPVAGTGTIKIKSLADDEVYTGSTNVTLFGLGATDDAGILGLYAKNSADTDYPSTMTWYSDGMTMSFTLTNTEGLREVSVIYEDANNNKQDPLFVTGQKDTIILDLSAPAVSSFTISDWATASTGWTNATQPGMALAAADPVLPGGKLGSGESPDGTTADSSGRKSMRFSNDGTAWGEWLDYATSHNAWTLSSGSDGQRNVFVQVKDYVGNISAARTASIKLDTVAPQALWGFSSANQTGILYTRTLANTLYVSSSEDVGTASVSGYYGFALSNGNSTLSSGAVALTTNPFVAITLVDSGDGTKLVPVSVYDKAGNKTDANLSIVLDRTPPTPGSLGIRDSVTGANIVGGATSKSTVILDFAASDALSPVAEYAVSLDTASPATKTWNPYATSVSEDILSDNGPHTLFVWFKDAAGNETAGYASAAVSYDNTPPNSTLTFSSVSYTSTGNISLDYGSTTVGDGGKTIDVQFSNNNQVTGWSAAYRLPSAATQTIIWNLVSGAGGSSTNGTRTVYARFTDNLGNTATKSLSVYFDNTKPVISSVSIQGYVSGVNDATNSATPTILLSASDNLTASAALQICFSNNNSTWSAWEAYSSTKAGWDITAVGSGGNAVNGNKMVYVKVRDAQTLNESNVVSDSIIYDNVAPSASMIVSDPVSGSSTYLNEAAGGVCNISFTPTEAGSGMYQMAYFNVTTLVTSSWASYASTVSSFLMSRAEGKGGITYQVKYRMRDRAGNEADISDTILWDPTKPSVTAFSITSNTTTRSGVTFSVTANDGGQSGLTQISLSNNGSTWSSWLGFTISNTNFAPGWALLPLNGSKTVSVRVKDAAGNISNSVNASITLAEIYGSLSLADITAPSGLFNAGDIDVRYMTTGSFTAAVETTIVVTTSNGKYSNLSKFKVTALNALTKVVTIAVSTVTSAGTEVFTPSSFSLVDGNYINLDTGAISSTSSSLMDCRWYKGKFEFTVVDSIAKAALWKP